MRLSPIFALAFVGVMAGVGAELYYQAQGPETLRATVTDKERQVNSDGDDGVSSKYIVFTDKEVFENTDSLLRKKFNSSDIQGSLKRECVYDLTVYGFRSHFFSIYRNVIAARHVPTEQCPTAPRPR